MIVASLIAALSAGAPAPCVVPVPAGAVAKGKSWYVAGSVVAFGGKVWEKYGLPRVLMPGEVAQAGVYKGAAVYHERGVKDYEVIYVLVDLGACSFQPYQVKR
ncbi:MAG: hypothetical protein V4574_15145 [Pseudomonadota bacterium]